MENALLRADDNKSILLSLFSLDLPYLKKGNGGIDPTSSFIFKW
jgi:hypothetical protein